MIAAGSFAFCVFFSYKNNKMHQLDYRETKKNIFVLKYIIYADMYIVLGYHLLTLLSNLVFTASLKRCYQEYFTRDMGISQHQFY